MNFNTTITKLKILSLLFLFLLVSACEVSDQTSEDSFTDLDSPPGTAVETEPHIKVENMFGEKIAVEFWRGDNIQYIPDRHEVKADNLKNIITLEIESLNTEIFTLSNPVDAFVIVGVDVSDDLTSRYEYLTDEKFPNLVNGSGLRIDAKGVLKPFDNNKCTLNLSSTEIDSATQIVKLVENTANDLSGQWQAIKAISNPLDTLLRFTTALLQGNSVLVFNELAGWTVSNGTYTHLETLVNTPGSTELTLTTQFLWGNDFSGHNSDEVISQNIHDPANYFTNLSTEIINDKIKFTYTEAKSLAPILGVPVSAIPGSYEINIIEWLERIKNNFKSIQWQMDLAANHTTSTESLQTTLNFTGRPSFNISIDTINQRIDFSQNPLTLKLTSVSDSPSNTGSSINQNLLLKNWTLKVFPDDNGAKGVVEFDVSAPTNFNYSGFISYNSDASTKANIFLQCTEDQSPIRY